MTRPRTALLAIAVTFLCISSLAVLSVASQSRSLTNNQTHEPEVLQSPLSHDNIPLRDAEAGGWFYFSGDDPSMEFTYRAPGYDLGLTTSGYTIRLHDTERVGEERGTENQEGQEQGMGSGNSVSDEQIRVIFRGSQRVEPVGQDGHMDDNGVQRFPTIRYHDLYPGIDLVFRITDAGPKYDLIVSPGADPAIIRMVYRGADDLFLDRSGNLHLTAGAFSYTEERPVSYQTRGDEVIPVRSEFTLRGNSVTFRLGAYDRSRELVIDPLLYSSYFGGSLEDRGHAIAMDSEGNTYIAGYTSSTDFPTTIGAYDEEHNGGGDVFVLKLNAEGSDLLFSTYVGGTGDEGTGNGIRPLAIVLDDENNVYVAGTTGSDDFPTTPGGFRGSYSGGGSDLFVFKLASDGSDLTYSTFIGGRDTDFGTEISMVLDPSNQVILTGQTLSDDFPTTDDAYDRTYHGNGDGVIVKLSADGSELVYGSYLGGTGVDDPSTISLDDQGCVLISGSTASTDFPTSDGAYDEEHNGGLDVFVTRLDSQCTEIQYSTFIGSSEDDKANHHLLDDDGRIIVTGETFSSGFPTTSGAYDRSHDGNSEPDAFVTILSAEGDTLSASTFIGGSASDLAVMITQDSNGDLILTGETFSSGFPTTPDAYDTSLGSGGGGSDLFIVRMDDSLTSLRYGSFIGGNGDETFGSMLHDQDDNVILTGTTLSDDLRTTQNAYDDSQNGEQDGFLFVLNLLTANITDISPSPALVSDTITLGGTGFNGGAITTYRWFSSLDGELSIGSDSEIDVSNLSLGIHAISLRVKDDLGYWSDDVSMELIIHEPPEAHIDSILPSPALEGDTIDFSGHGTDDGVVVHHEWTSSIDGQLHSGNGSDFTSDPLSNGTHLISYRVMDEYDVWSEFVSMELVVNGIPRAWIIDIDPSRANETDPVSFSGTGSDDGSITNYSWRSNRDGFLSNQSSFGIDSLSNGTHTIYFKVKDDRDAWSHEISRELSINGRPRATIESISPGFALEGQFVLFTGNATDDGSITAYEWVSSWDALLGTSRTLNLTDLSVGHHTITFRARDDLGVWSAEALSSISINGIPTARIVSILPEHPTEGMEVTLIGTGTDDGTLTHYSWESSVDGILGTNRTIVVSNLSTGPHIIWFEVRDEHGIWSNPVSEEFFVNGRPTAVINTIFPSSSIVGTPVTMDGIGIDDGNITVYEWLSDLQGLLAFTNTTYLTNLTIGNHIISFRVRDDLGVWSTWVSQAVTVEPLPQPTLSLTVDPVSVQQGDAIEISTTYTGHEHEIAIEIRDGTGELIFSILLPIGENGTNTFVYPFDEDALPGGYEVRVFTGNVSDSIVIDVVPRYVDIHHEISEGPTIVLRDDASSGSGGQDSGDPISTPFLTTSDLTVEFVVNNPDNDELITTYTWYVNSINLGINDPVLFQYHFDRGDDINVSVSIIDVYGNHTAVGNSDMITIGNSLPEITSAEITPSNPMTNVDLDVSYEFFDGDGDAGSGTTFEWQVNRQQGAGWEPPEPGGQSHAAQLTSRDQLWRCIITPSDGIDSGNPFTTAPVEIGNSLPVAIITSPSPEKDHYRTEDILFDSRTSFDIDDDDLTHTWTIDGEEYISEYFTLPLPVGDHPVSLVMSDGTIHTKRTFMLTIAIEPRPDLFTLLNESYFTNLLPNGRGEVGREITFTVFVWNKGDVEASATVQFFLDSKEGTVIGQKEVRVPAKQWDTAFVSWNPDGAGNVRIIAKVVDSDPAESDETNNIVSRNVDIDAIEPAPPKGPDGSAIVFTGAVSVGVFGLALATYEPWKYRFFVFLIPLYTKLNHDNRMDNENRSKILGFVLGVEEGKRASGGLPGVSYSTIKKKLGFSNGALAYHLSVLEREGDVRSEKVGKYRLYFPTRVQKPKTMFLERLTELQQRLVEEIKKHTEVSQKRLVKSTMESQQVISYNLNRLEQKGIIFLKKRGNRSYCRLNPEYLSNQ